MEPIPGPNDGGTNYRVTDAKRKAVIAKQVAKPKTVKVKIGGDRAIIRSLGVRVGARKDHRGKVIPMLDTVAKPAGDDFRVESVPDLVIRLLNKTATHVYVEVTAE